jgi:hypothetical protein
LELNTKLQSRLEVVLETVENHFKDQEYLNVAKALQRTVVVHQLNSTNAQLSETVECARDVTHSLSFLLIQLERVVDATQTPSPVMLTSPPVNYDILSPRILPYKRLRTRIPNDLPSVELDVYKDSHSKIC